MNKKNKKGFTLIELILVVGIISIMLIGIYAAYKKEYNKYEVNRQAQYIQQIFQGINNYLETAPTDSSNLTTISGVTNAVGFMSVYVTPTNLIKANIIPTEMINSQTTIQNLFGGQVNFSATSFPNGLFASVPVVDMKLTNIAQNACALLATNYRIINYEKILVNGIVVKDVGTNVPNFSNVAAACNSNNNTIDIDYYPTKLSANVYQSTNSLGHIRGKEPPYYIAPPGQNTTSPGGSSACYGGASWNSTDSVCECPNGTEWNGNTCVAFGTPGVCPLGQSWSISANACVVIAGGTSGVYQAGRQIPSNIGVAPQITSTPLPLSCTNAPLPAGATTPSNGNGNYDGVLCERCIYGSWNGSRCVAP